MESKTIQRIKLDAYLSKIPSYKITYFNCPTCSNEIGWVKPNEQGFYTSHCLCPDCAQYIIKMVYPNGTIKLSILNTKVSKLWKKLNIGALNE